MQSPREAKVKALVNNVFDRFDSLTRNEVHTAIMNLIAQEASDPNIQWHSCSDKMPEDGAHVALLPPKVLSILLARCFGPVRYDEKARAFWDAGEEGYILPDAVGLWAYWQDIAPEDYRVRVPRTNGHE